MGVSIESTKSRPSVVADFVHLQTATDMGDFRIPQNFRMHYDWGYIQIFIHSVKSKNSSHLALFVGVALFDILPFHFTSFIETIRSWNLPWIVLDPLKFVIAFFITFHTLNGIRFLVTWNFSICNIMH
jgi:hypothetical protein